MNRFLLSLRIELIRKQTRTTALMIVCMLTGITAFSQIARGPYLNMGNQTSIVIRWKSTAASNSKVTVGTVLGTYPMVFSNATSSVDHEITVTGLTADTKYYYTIGTSTTVQQSGAANFFRTLPVSTSTRKIKILALGDCGTASTNQANTRDAFIAYAAAKNIEPDAWLILGDNAYNAGLETEYTTGFFNSYSGNIMKNMKLYPCPGNHDYANSSANLQLRGTSLPYYNNFTMPTNGEIGGLASNTEAFYSYDIGNIHFVSLDAYGTENGTSQTKLYDTAFGNKQADWLRADLTANTKTWTVVYFHHTPYTMGSHNSDTESDLRELHDSIPPILERFGVDLVINGHSHVYERSYLLKNLYGNSTTYAAANNRVSSSTATYSGSGNTCPYTYSSGKTKHGTVYVVAGSSAQLGGQAAGWPLAFMATANNANGGCFYFEVDSNRLDAKFVSYTLSPLTPFVRDSFTIFKDVNKVTNLVVAQNDVLNVQASWRGTYIWPNNGSVTTQGITVNTAATGVFNFIVRDGNTCLKDSFHVTVTPPLPVLVTSFTAQLNKDIVLLDWTTSQEINSKFFTIEKSTDGSTFTLLGNVNASGNSSLPRNYHMNDLQPVEGVNYYRLSQTDINGTRKNIEIKRVTYKGAKDFNATIVNAGAGILNVAIHNSVGGMVQMKVVDMIGREIQKETINTGNGNVTHTIQLNKGTYVLVLVNSNGETISTKIIAD